MQKWTVTHRNLQALSAGLLVAGERLRLCSQMMVKPLVFLRSQTEMWLSGEFAMFFLSAAQT